MDATKMINATYKVADADKVKLTIIIGDGQRGIPVAMLGSNIIQIGNTHQILIGNGADLRGKTLIVSTLVDDVNPKTNHTSISYIIEGGASILHEINTEDVINNCGSIFYRDKFTFC
jgi:hypothetical protein